MAKYKVVKIIDDKSIVINAGFNNGIKRGDIFQIFISGQKVYDPDTKESLGTLDYIKAEIEAVTVLDKISVCKNREFESIKTSPFDVVETIERSLGVESYYYRKELPIDPTEISGGFDDFDRKIHVGDLVRQIDDDLKK